MHRQRASERQAFDCGQHLGQGQRLVQDHGAHRGIAQARGVHRQGRKRKPHRRGTGQQRRVVGAQRRLSAKGEKISNKTHRSKVDPDSRIARKGNFSETYLGHGVSYVMDNKSRVILGADHNLPNRNADAETAVRLIARLKWAYKLSPRTLGADKGYATGLFLHWLLEQEVLPHVPIMDARSRNEKEIYPIEQFHYDAEKDQFTCPQGKTLRYWAIHKHSKQHVYRASPKDCGQCPVKALCTRATYRSLSYHIYESSIDVARRLTK